MDTTPHSKSNSKPFNERSRSRSPDRYRRPVKRDRSRSRSPDRYHRPVKRDRSRSRSPNRHNRSVKRERSRSRSPDPEHDCTYKQQLEQALNLLKKYALELEKQKPSKIIGRQCVGTDQNGKKCQKMLTMDNPYPTCMECCQLIQDRNGMSRDIGKCSTLGCPHYLRYNDEEFCFTCDKKQKRIHTPYFYLIDGVATEMYYD